MPRRNLLAIFSAIVISVVCYQTADRNPFGRYFSEVVNHIESSYVSNVDRGKLWDGAVKGMIGELQDPYSHYMGPKEAAKQEEELEQQFGGIGIQVALDPKTKRLTVISPIVGAPAYRAGIQAGDIIAKIDGASTDNLTVEDASRKLRGLPGEPVQLTIERPGQRDPIELPIIQRENVQIDSVLGDVRHDDDRWSFMLDRDQRIGYVRLISFGGRTVDELRAALATLKAEGMKGLILDLRNNPGGLLPAAVGVCDLFVPSGKTIVSIRGREEKYDRKYLANGGQKYDLPLVVLVNRGSASASEIVAACLQDHHLAVVIGERTWGKGSVQNIIQLNGQRGNLTLTTAGYVRPSEKPIHRHPDDDEQDEWGVKPDDGHEVKMSNDDWTRWNEWRSDRDIVRPHHREATAAKAESKPENGDQDDATEEDTRWKNDPPLRKALEYLESKIKEGKEKTNVAA